MKIYQEESQSEHEVQDLHTLRNDLIKQRQQDKRIFKAILVIGITVAIVANLTIQYYF